MTDDAPTSLSAPSQPRRTDHERQYYFLPTAPLLRQRPHISDNLISMFGLEKIALAVRRTDPVTGEKINKLRKSYEGKIKNYNLPGVNKPVATPGQWIDGPSERPGLMDYSQEKWQEEKAGDKVATSQKAAVNLLAKLDRAVQMAPGKLDDGEKWKKLIGTDGIPIPRPAIAKGALVQQKSAHPSPKLSAAARPSRTSSKRRYDDDSYEGYGGGFVDDDLSTMTEEEARSQGISLKKKRRKVR